MISDPTYAALFSQLERNQFNVANAPLKQRKAKLTKLQRALEGSYKKKFEDALYKDLKKPPVETITTELYPLISEIKLVKRHLRRWAAKEHVATPIVYLGSTSWIVNEPKGVCLIISPWNFPLLLALTPLVSAIAAGNSVIIKPSEITPHTSAVLAELIDELYAKDEIVLVEGAVETATALLDLPFNHIHFTGAPAIGKIVMRAAAKHLSSVTLELGGKSPTIVDRSASLLAAADKIVWGRFVNCGQTCVAPDYILVEEAVKDRLIDALQKSIVKFFTANPELSDSYGRIVSENHFNRLERYLEDARQKELQFICGGESNKTKKYIAPTIVTDVDEDALLMQEEIFGPILPIISFKNSTDVVRYINKKERPLALYVYSKNRKFQKFVIKNTRAGTTCINANVLQYANHNLPFGGTNESGIGKTHGVFGFREFSNQRAVFKQHTFGVYQLLFPPYTTFKRWLSELAMKWF